MGVRDTFKSQKVIPSSLAAVNSDMNSKELCLTTTVAEVYTIQLDWLDFFAALPLLKK